MSGVSVVLDVAERSRAVRRSRAKVPKGLWLRGVTWWTRVTAPDGLRRQVSLETRDLSEAKRFRAMLDVLSDPRHNSLDLVQRVYDGTLGVRELHARYAENRTGELRRAASDPDLAPHVDVWGSWLV